MKNMLNKTKNLFNRKAEFTLWTCSFLILTIFLIGFLTSQVPIIYFILFCINYIVFYTTIPIIMNLHTGGVYSLINDYYDKHTPAEYKENIQEEVIKILAIPKAKKSSITEVIGKIENIVKNDDTIFIVRASPEDKVLHLIVAGKVVNVNYAIYVMDRAKELVIQSSKNNHMVINKNNIVN